MRMHVKNIHAIKKNLTIITSISMESREMKIAIASGKGGTGKTTVATNLALSLGNVQLLDCDVEEPNSHLFLDIKLIKTEDVSILVPKINKDKCTLCGKCSEFCQYHALAILPRDVLLFPELCHGCGGCALVCPENAITEENRVIGVIESGHSSGIEFHHGILNIGEPMVSPLIHAVKRKAKNDRVVIIDSPPGTGCPFIASIEGSDYCILVTEPTPFGLYDLTITIGVVRKLSIPFGVVINRYGIGDSRIDTYCEKEAIPVLMRIPQEKRIATLYSSGVPFTKEMPEWSEKFIELFKAIEAEIRS